MIARAMAEAVFAEAVLVCDPAARVREAMADRELKAWLGEHPVGIAIGKAAVAMARGAGGVERGIVVSPFPGEVPPGWDVIVSAHPEPDERSVAAAEAVLALVESARDPNRILSLISGGASALVELPRGSLEELRTTMRGLMAAGAPIAELNAVRMALSKIKGGELAARAHVPIATLAISDVVGDDLAVIGSGPTVLGSGESDLVALREARRERARVILAEHGVRVPVVLGEPARRAGTDDDRAAPDYARPVERRARVLAPMSAFASAAHEALSAQGLHGLFTIAPIQDDVASVADELMATLGIVVAWGEPTLRLSPDPGEGGRAQQLALELAFRLRGTERSAFVAGSDGIDGPPPRTRPAPAGAFVDGRTWDAIRAAGIDPAAALARCDAGTALAAVGALIVTGPTGINHADLVLLG